MLRWSIKQWMIGEARAVRRSAEDPEAAQRATFGRLQRLLQDAEQARRSGFARCRTLEDCRGLPFSDADSLKPLFDDAYRRGDDARALFGSSRIQAFGRTSGTIQPKLLPLNASYFASYDRSLDRLTACRFHATGEWETLLRGKYVNVGSRAHVSTAPCGLPVADISGLLPTRAPWLQRRVCLPRHEDLFIADWPEKVNRTLDQAERQPVHTISGVPALAFDFARRAKARFGVTTLAAQWPQLRWFIYGGQALSTTERQAIELDWCGSPGRLHFVEAYFATEGALGFSIDPADPALALNTLELLFIFLPLDGGPPRFAHEVESGRTYALVITTPGGLINYRIGDRVRIESAKPLRVRVVGREQDEISLTGERITLAQLDEALRRAWSAARSPEEWTVIWPAKAERPHLCWGYPATRPAPDPVQLDRTLAEVNPLFAEALYVEHVIAPSKIVPLPREAYERHRAPALGFGQFKPRRMLASADEFFAAYGFIPPVSPPSASATSPSSDSSAAV